jgi:hypothetical protein
MEAVLIIGQEYDIFNMLSESLWFHDLATGSPLRIGRSDGGCRICARAPQLTTEEFVAVVDMRERWIAIPYFRMSP